MTTYDLYSKRQRRLNKDTPDVYIYDDIPKTLRIQIAHIIRDTYGEDKFAFNDAYNAYEYMNKTLCKEYGVFSLQPISKNDEEAVIGYFLNCDDYEHCLDIIELSFQLIEDYVAPNYYNYKQRTTSSQSPDNAIEELNNRFKENGIGYEYTSGELIRIDSKLIHSETVKPTLLLLKSNSYYTGSNEEFLKAHEHFRHKRYKECLVEALKSFESLMKGICKQNSWVFNDNDPAKKLINICLDKKLIPEYLQNQFSSLRIILESGIPTIRNKEGGHGQGPEVTSVPEHFASYALHLTASNLLFLMQCNEEIINQ